MPLFACVLLVGNKHYKYYYPVYFSRYKLILQIQHECIFQAETNVTKLNS